MSPSAQAAGLAADNLICAGDFYLDLLPTNGFLPQSPCCLRISYISYISYLLSAPASCYPHLFHRHLCCRVVQSTSHQCMLWHGAFRRTRRQLAVTRQAPAAQEAAFRSVRNGHKTNMCTKSQASPGLSLCFCQHLKRA